LAYLGEQTLSPTCSIVKLPNISASFNQLQNAISELRAKGYNVPLYPTDPQTPEDLDVQARYAKVTGSAVNPVLREGNSDRRVAPPVKAYAQKNPHRMGLWSKASRTHVSHMEHSDFYGSEVSTSMPADANLQIVLQTAESGESIVLKDSVSVVKDEVIDASFMSIKALNEFYETEMQDAKESELLLSLHLKATMMKISDPILFGHCIKIFFREWFDKYGKELEAWGANPNSGLGSILEIAKEAASPEQYAAMEKDLEECYEHRPWLAMVDSDKGISNLHAPNDIIIGTCYNLLCWHIMIIF
jgi:isocitrate dehydrogenase